MSRRAPLWVIVLLCVIIGPFIGWFDFHQSEVQPAVLLLLVCSAALAWLRPGAAWLVALLLGLSIVETHFVAGVLGAIPKTPYGGPPYAGLIALIPASIGVFTSPATRIRPPPSKLTQS